MSTFATEKRPAPEEMGRPPLPRLHRPGLLPHFLGNPHIKTQHFMGQSRWIAVSSDEIRGHHQMRVAHQRYKDDEMKEVACVGHAHGAAVVHYRKVEGVWKFAGLEPDIRWSEGEYARIFAHE
ncbi:hypothetical protein CFE70_005870 [Pyrenophora teres f. teres 0-1]